MHLDGRKLFLICDLTLSQKKNKKDNGSVMKMPTLRKTKSSGKVRVKERGVLLYKIQTLQH